LQEGGIPFWIAGGGEQVTLRIAAQYAQYTNFDGTPAGFAHKSRVLAEHCRRLGRDYDTIVRSANYNVIIGRDEREVADKLDRLQDKYTGLVGAQLAARQLSAYRGMPGVGTPEQIAANLSALKVSGMTYAITYFPDLAYDTSSLELFESEVIPALAG
jgi:alkanesulfonate monooxygenase SsuD/methylene tetrahydromethanopterin reductase-like flavin-dependent oxidoreductase (luciferase family)